MKNLSVVFMGTPTFSVPILASLIEKTNVVLVVSQPDREKDRKGNILPTPIKMLANENNIEVFQPTKIKEDYQRIIDANPDIIITCAYGQIIPEALLNYPKYGCINVHGSLLPKLRGGAPIHHAIINGDNETGITIMYMDKKMDAGDIISQRKIPIGIDDNLDLIYEKMSYLGRDLLMETLPSIVAGTNTRIPQDVNKVTFGKVKLYNDEGTDSGAIKKSLMDAEKLRLQLINKYVKYLGNTYASLTLKKIELIIDELRYKLYMKEFYKEQRIYQTNEKEGKRGR